MRSLPRHFAAPAHAPVQYLKQAFAAALSTWQAPVQYVQPAPSVSLPSSRTPVQFAQLAPIVYEHPHPSTSQATSHMPRQFSTFLQTLSLWRKLHQSPNWQLQQSRMVPARNTNMTTTGRVATCPLRSTMLIARAVTYECHSGCSFGCGGLCSRLMWAFSGKTATDFDALVKEEMQQNMQIHDTIQRGKRCELERNSRAVHLM